MEKAYSSVYGIEKASMLKRISAYILDAILTVILASGFVFAISAIINYDSYYDKMNQYYDEFEEENGFSFNMFSKNEDELNDKEKQIKEISSKALEDLTEEEKQIKEEYEKAIDDFVNDKDMLYIYNMLINLTLLMVTISVLLAILIIEFVLPLVFKNGQTIGKKCFGLCLVKNNCVRINAPILFIRTILGKFTVETMIPIYIIIMIIFGGAGITGTIVLVLILFIQLILVISTKNNCLIHDLMAGTVVVDKNGQMIFDTENDLIEFKKNFHKEESLRKEYK